MQCLIPIRVHVELPDVPVLKDAFLWDPTAPYANVKRFAAGWAKDHVETNAGKDAPKGKLSKSEEGLVNTLAAAIESAMLPYLLHAMQQACQTSNQYNLNASLLNRNQGHEMLFVEAKVDDNNVFQDRLVWHADARSLLSAGDADVARIARTTAADLNVPEATQEIACNLREQVDAVRRQRLGRIQRKEKDDRPTLPFPSLENPTGTCKPRVAKPPPRVAKKRGVSRIAKERRAYTPRVMNAAEAETASANAAAAVARANEKTAPPPPPAAPAAPPPPAPRSALPPPPPRSALPPPPPSYALPPPPPSFGFAPPPPPRW